MSAFHGLLGVLKHSAQAGISDTRDSVGGLDALDENFAPLPQQVAYLQEVEECLPNVAVLRKKLRNSSPAQLFMLQRQARSLLHIACGGSKVELASIVLLVAEFQFPIDRECGKIGRPLHIACNHGRLDIVEYLLTYSKEESGVDTPISGTKTLPIHVAAAAGHLPVVQALLDEEFRHFLTARDDAGRTVLLVASDNNHFNVAHYLVRNFSEYSPFDISAVSTDLRMAWMGAIDCGNLCFLRMLAEEGRINMHHPTLYSTPLAYACSSHIDDALTLAIVRYLVEERGEDVNERNNARLAPFHVAANKGKQLTAEYLKDRTRFGYDLDRPSASFVEFYRSGMAMEERGRGLQHGLSVASCEDSFSGTASLMPVPTSAQLARISSTRLLGAPAASS